MQKKNTKYKKTPGNIRLGISEHLPCVKRKFLCVYPLVISLSLYIVVVVTTARHGLATCIIKLYLTRSIVLLL